jgi:predicted AAA+ superfamily ATPase
VAIGQFDLVKCGLCGKAFVYEVGKRPTCPDCAEEENDLYTRIRRLISDHPDRRMNVAEIARILNIEERKINYLVECGMFNLVTNAGLTNKRSDDY